MGDNYFNHIAEELLKQRERMGDLLKEKQTLRHQIAELHAGKNIFIEIEGHRIALIEDALPAATAATDAASPQATPAPVASASSTATAPSGEKKASGKAPFLEEIILDEFAAAMTSPVAAIARPPEKEERTEEEQKEALRRELMGSYLLE
jgi:hypothetical protein